MFYSYSMKRNTFMVFFIPCLLLLKLKISFDFGFIHNQTDAFEEKIVSFYCSLHENHLNVNFIKHCSTYRI